MIQIKAHTCKLYAIKKKTFGLILSITSWFRVERMSKKQNKTTKPLAKRQKSDDFASMSLNGIVS